MPLNAARDSKVDLRAGFDDISVILEKNLSKYSNDSHRKENKENGATCLQLRFICP